DNTGAGPVTDATLQLNYLNMLTAHIGWLLAPRGADGNPAAAGKPAPTLVGRISNASQGSVSVGVEWPTSGNPSVAWSLQTPAGGFYGQATAGFRTMQYSPLVTRVPTAVFPGFGFSPWRRRW